MEKALLVIVELDRFDSQDWPVSEELIELEELALSTGGRVVGHVIARRHKPVASTLIGEGKLEEIHERIHETKAQVAIFNLELSPAQQRNVEDILGIKTIDRTQLILDIFAQRAKSQEGKVQVELAQLEYLLPRLSGKGVMLSRLGGGIGTRGPGEQKLEVDRRHIRRRISKLKNELHSLSKRRQTIRDRRKEARISVVALVGYTNAGKTTLLNRLTGAQGKVENRPFTTLDPLARRLRLPDGRFIVLTDTVGFLHKLPHHLIESFKATLEEAQDADILLHVLDASDSMALDHASAVGEVLAMLGLSEKPIITVLNKIDKLDGPSNALSSLQQELALSVSICAKDGTGIDKLLEAISDQLEFQSSLPVTIKIPKDQIRFIDAIYQMGEVLDHTESGDSALMTARIPKTLKERLKSYLIP